MQVEQILEKVRAIVQEVVTQEAPAVNEGKWPENSIRALQHAGIGGLVVPKENGGLGQGLLQLVKVSELLGEHCASTSLCFGMHCVGTAVIATKATAYQKKEYLEPIAAGKHLTTLALSEPGSGSHFYYPQSQLLAVSTDEFKLNGKKSFVTNGGQADSYVLSTVAIEPDAPPNQFSCVVLDKDTPGMEWGPHWKGLGMRGNSSISLNLEGVHIPAHNLLGEKGDQLWYIFHVVAPYFLLAMSGTYLGIAQAAFNEARQHLLSRSYSHSGQSLGQVHVLQHKLGMLWSKIERSRQLIYQAASEGDKGGINAVLSILSAKAEVGSCVTEAVNEAMTLSGGIAYRENSRFDVLLRDSRAAHVMSPTTDLLYTWLGRALLDQPILSD